MTEHATLTDASLYPRQAGRVIAQAMMDGDPDAARRVWGELWRGERPVAAAEAALSIAERGLSAPSPRSIIDWLEG